MVAAIKKCAKENQTITLNLGVHSSATSFGRGTRLTRIDGSMKHQTLLTDRLVTRWGILSNQGFIIYSCNPIRRSDMFRLESGQHAITGTSARKMTISVPCWNLSDQYLTVNTLKCITYGWFLVLNGCLIESIKKKKKRQPEFKGVSTLYLIEFSAENVFRHCVSLNSNCCIHWELWPST